MRDLWRRFPEELRNWQKSRLWSNRRSRETAGISEKIMVHSQETAEILMETMVRNLDLVETPEKTMAQDQEAELVPQVQILLNRRSVKESRIAVVTAKRDISIR